MVESLTGVILSPNQKNIIVKGASELGLVNAALEDTMIDAYKGIREIYACHKSIDTLCTAAFVKAINHIGTFLPKHGAYSHNIHL